MTTCVTGRKWSPDQDEQLRALAAEGMPHREISAIIGRTKRALEARLDEIMTDDELAAAEAVYTARRRRRHIRDCDLHLKELIQHHAPLASLRMKPEPRRLRA